MKNVKGKVKLFLLSCLFLTSLSCNQRINKTLNELKNMPPPDYSYVIEPKFSESKESAEFKLRELFVAEEARIGIFHVHRYDQETQTQVDEKMWLQAVLLNSKNLNDYRNDEPANALSKEVAEFVTKQIDNTSDYEKIQITWVAQWNDGNARQEKRNVYLSIPDFNIIDP